MKGSGIVWIVFKLAFTYECSTSQCMFFRFLLILQDMKIGKKLTKHWVVNSKSILTKTIELDWLIENVYAFSNSIYFDKPGNSDECIEIFL